MRDPYNPRSCIRQNRTHLIGRKVGRLTVIRDSGKRTHKGNVIWLCLCSCGNLKEVFTTTLTRRTTRSCGCLRSDESKKRVKKWGLVQTKHGEAKTGKRTRLYKIWCCMKERCSDKNNVGYKYYGSRGIIVCASWLHDFLNFKSWALSHGYKKNMTIDRINNDGNYEPSNCQFLTRSENSKKAIRDRKLYV